MLLVLKIVNVGRFYKLIRTCRNFVILVICRSPSVKRTYIYSTTLICDLSVYIVDALKFIDLVFVQLFQLFLSCKMRDELCRK